jgi:hypothetical protein
LDTTVGVSDFVFLRVDVSITVLKIAKFILSLELRRGGDGGSYGSSIRVGTCVAYTCGSVSWVCACSSIAGISSHNTMNMGMGNILSRRSGNAGE